MLIAFFADDHSALHAAHLAAQGFASVDRTVAVVRPARFDRRDVTARHGVSMGEGGPPGSGLLDATASGFDAGQDTCLVLPLAALHGGAGHIHADLHVVTAGTTFFGGAAACAAVEGTAASGQGGRAARPPVWLLPCSSLPGLRIPVPRLERTLPVTLPRLNHVEARALFAGCADLDLLRRGIALAAALEAAAADPYAGGVRPSDMAGLIASRTTDRQRRLSAGLAALARRYAEVQETAAQREPMLGPGRGLPAAGRPRPTRMTRTPCSNPAGIRGGAPRRVMDAIGTARSSTR